MEWQGEFQELMDERSIEVRKTSWLPVCLAGALVAMGAFGGAPGTEGILGP
jgi:hypothetical protein